MPLVALRRQVTEGHGADILAADIPVRCASARALIAALHTCAHFAKVNADRFRRTCVLFAVEDRAVAARRARIARTCFHTRTVTMVAAFVPDLRRTRDRHQNKCKSTQDLPTSESHQSSGAEDDEHRCTGVKRGDLQGQSTFPIAARRSDLTTPTFFEMPRSFEMFSPA